MEVRSAVLQRPSGVGSIECRGLLMVRKVVLCDEGLEIKQGMLWTNKYVGCRSAAWSVVSGGDLLGFGEVIADGPLVEV